VFSCLCIINLKTGGHMLTTKNVCFVKLSKYVMDFTIASLSSRRSKNIYGTSNSESGWRSYASRKMLCCRNSRPESGLPTAGTADPSWDSWPMSGLSTYVGTSDGRDFWPESGLLTHVGTSDICRGFWRSGLLTRVGTSGRPNKKGCSDLTFWILIRTILNLWET
jgi:hypothetical protein